MGSFKALTLFSFLLMSSLTARAELSDGILQEAWSANQLGSAVNAELADLDIRKAESIAAYNDLGTKLATYDGWCNTYGITALRNLLEGGLFMKLFSATTYPAYHIYSNDPYFSGVRGQLDSALDSVNNTGFDIGKCSMAEKQSKLMRRDPRQFDRGSDDFNGASYPYVVLAGNIRLIEEEREILLELRGMITGTGASNDSATVEKFIRDSYGRLHDKITSLRARTLTGYEITFRVPLGRLESYRGKELGFKDNEPTPNFFWILQRRAYYVNQARVAAGKVFEVSVDHFTKAEAIESAFLQIIQEAAAR